MPNSAISPLPLQEALCEVRFPGDPEVEVQRGIFYRSIKEEFPVLLVPKASEGQPVALQHYRFSSRDEKSWLAIAINSFAYRVAGENYQDFLAFKERFKNYLEKFLEIYSYLEGFTRIGLRYINHFPVGRGVDGEISYIPLKLPEAVSGKVQNTLRITEHQIGGGVIRVVVDTTQQELSPKNLALLDFDFIYNAADGKLIPVSELSDRLEGAHGVVKDFLHSFIADDYAKKVGLTWT